MIPYGKQSIDEKDIQAVIDVLRSDWLTTGPNVSKFENILADFVGAEYAVAVSNGTAALHTAMYALNIGPGDEVIVPAITFAATANCIVFQGGTPVFADVAPDTLLIDPVDIEKKITPRTKAVIAVDYAGQPCDYEKLTALCSSHNIQLVADACHALGAEYKGRKAGSLAGLNVFSFHPVKHITTGEGGMITTDDEEFYHRMKIFRNHGITTDHHQRSMQSSWAYEMVDLGYNYRITDFQCALGISQIKKLEHWIQRRQEIAVKYNNIFNTFSGISPLTTEKDVSHAYHLYVVNIDKEILKKDRDQIFDRMREIGIGVNVHYIPVHLHPYYRKKFNTAPGICPKAEEAYRNIISLPMYPELKDKDIDTVIEALKKSVS